MPMPEHKKTAIVYDWIDKWGGVERVLLALHEMFPHADFFTSYFDPKTAGWAKNIPIKTSFIQKLPDMIKKNRVLSVLLYPFAFESFDFGSYDLVISVTSSFSKSIITKPSTKHICYLLTPTRFLWSHQDEYIGSTIMSKPFIEYLKKWDLVASSRPDTIISLSETVRKRCKKYYKRETQVIYPPFDIDYWEKIKSNLKTQNSNLQLKSQNYFLIVSRLEKYKKIDLAINVFNKLPNRNLIIVGIGSQENELKRIADRNIQFIPYVSDEELAGLYSGAKALIMPQEEDFGYVSLEAQFFGCPVIAFGKGGATETVLENKTGMFFSSLEQFSTISYNLKARAREFGPENAQKFDKTNFVKKFLEAVTK